MHLDSPGKARNVPSIVRCRPRAVLGHGLRFAGRAATRAPRLRPGPSFLAGGRASGSRRALIAASAIDGGWERTLQGSGSQSSAALQSAARLGDNWGSPGAIVTAGAIWLDGRLFHDSTRARLGGRALEALALSGTITGGIKGLAGRARPYADPDGPASWGFARGIHDARYQSFPSGHATAAFAFASAITAQLDRDRSPLARWAGPVLYSLAAVTAFARTYNDKHWTSDVVAGAAVGTLSGLAVVRWHEAHAGSWIDRVLLGR